VFDQARGVSIPLNRPLAREGHVLRISDAFILATLSGFSYAAAYAFERGFAAKVGIPPELIDLRWTTIFGAAGAVFLGAVITVAAYRLPSAPSRISPVIRLVLTTLMIVPVFGLVAFLILGLSRWKLVLVGSVSLCILFVLVVALLALWAGPQRSNIWSSKQLEEKTDDLLVAGIRVPGWVEVGAAWLLFSVPLAAVAGGVTAIDMQDFLVTNSGKAPQAVIRIYGDKIVTAELDRETQTLQPIYRILPLTDTGRVFTAERLRNYLPPCTPVSAVRDSLSNRGSRILTALQQYLAPDFAEPHERCNRYRQRMDSSAKLPVTAR
jgi:hypothetical protein